MDGLRRRGLRLLPLSVEAALALKKSQLLRTGLAWCSAGVQAKGW